MTLKQCLLLSALTLTGCASAPRYTVGAISSQDTNIRHPGIAAANKGSLLKTEVEELQANSAKRAKNAQPLVEPAVVSQLGMDDILHLVSDEKLDVSLPAQPLPQFIDTVFGQILQIPYATGAGVAERREIVTLRGAINMSKQEFFATVQTALKDYGISLQLSNGAILVAQNGEAASLASDIIRSRASPETPASARPVTQFIELSALDVGAMMTLLDETYPNRGAITFTPRTETNTLVLKGGARDVAAAAQVIAALDKPRFSDGQIGRIKPIFWNAEQFANAIADAMRAEGYRSDFGAGATPTSFTFLPVPLLNELMVFSNDPEIFDRVIFWANELDKPSAVPNGEGVFVYQVENMPASELARMLDDRGPDPRAVLSDSAAVRRTSLERPPSGSSVAVLSAGGANGDLSVDAGGNRIIFRGTATEYAQMQRLMSELDTPRPQVLIELTIAEVTLNDETRFGVEWLLQQKIGAGTLKIDTRGATKSEAGGLGASYAQSYPSGSVQAALNAIATNRNLNILSTPRLLTRSGGEAQILVGTDVPIITSQRAASSQSSGDTDILQSVQYRQTGVILNVRPVVYGDGRVDVEIFQEVSSQQPNDSSTIDSPLILNRSVQTQLSLSEGTTGVIGGLIQDSFSKSQTGIPLLKDVPLLGLGFRSNGVSSQKVELLILVTPHIVQDDKDMADLSGGYSRSLNGLMRKRGVQTYTLIPWRTPMSPVTIHGPAPEPQPDAAAAPMGDPGATPPSKAEQVAQPKHGKKLLKPAQNSKTAGRKRA